jgi:hypothetical protein
MTPFAAPEIKPSVPPAAEASGSTLSTKLQDAGFKDEISLKGPADVPGDGLRKMSIRIVNGKIRRPLADGTLGSFKNQILDVVLTKDGELVVGRAHSVLSRGQDVVFAGQLKFDGNGVVTEISNASGHYMPQSGMGLTQAAKKYLSNLGVDVSKAQISEFGVPQ